MAKTVIEESFFSDERVEFLSKLNGEDRLLTEGRLIRLYTHCINELYDVFDNLTLNRVCHWVDGDISERLAKADLAEKLSDNEFRIRGTTERIDEIKKRKEWSRKGGINSQRLRRTDKKAKKPEPTPTPTSGRPLSEPSKKTSNTHTPKDYQFVVDHWNDSIAPALGKPAVSIINDNRKKLMDRMFRHFPNNKEAWIKILNHATKVEWILKGLTFKFESYFEKDRFTQFYEEASENTDETKVNFLASQIPDMEPVLDDEELEGRM